MISSLFHEFLSQFFSFFLIFQVILVVKYVRNNVAENITIWKVQEFEAGVTKFAELHVGELHTHSTIGKRYYYST